MSGALAGLEAVLAAAGCPGRGCRLVVAATPARRKSGWLALAHLRADGDARKLTLARGLVRESSQSCDELLVAEIRDHHADERRRR